MWLGWMPKAVATHTILGSVLVLVLWMVALIALFVLTKRLIPLPPLNKFSLERPIPER